MGLGVKGTFMEVLDEQINKLLLTRNIGTLTKRINKITSLLTI